MTKGFIHLFSYLIFLLLPWYYLKSGNVQPVDIIILILLCLFVFSKQIYQLRLLKISSISFTLLIFLVYLLASFTIRYLFTNDSDTFVLIAQNFYIMVMTMTYLFLICYFYLNYEKPEFYRKILQFLLLTIIIPFSLILFSHQTTVMRGYLSFNNPNQLGIYALVNTAVLFYITLFARSNNIKINKPISLILINVYFLFFIISASRAAFGILFMYILFYFLVFQVKQIRESPLLSIAIITLLLVLPCWYLLIKILTWVSSVRETGAFAMSDMQSDIYTRMFAGISYNFSQLFIFLFGTGTASNPLRPDYLEYHNNFLEIFNQAGIAGLILYTFFNICVIRSLFREGILYLIPYLCYLEISFFHFTLRERINWYFFAFIIFICIYKKIDLLFSKSHSSSINQWNSSNFTTNKNLEVAAKNE